jgi:hypothetical protein
MVVVEVPTQIVVDIVLVGKWDVSRITASKPNFHSVN